MAGPSVTIEMSGDEFKLLRSLQKVIDKNREMDKSLKDVEKSGDKAGKEIGKSMEGSSSSLDKTIGRVADLAKGFGGISAIVASIAGGLGQVTKLMEEATKATESLIQARWNLASIADNPEEYRKFQAEADRISTTYGISREQSARLVFSADSAGYMSNLDYAARVAQQFGQAPVEEVAAKLPGMFDGRINATQALAGTAVAMKTSPADFAQISSAVATATQGGVFAGSSPEEVLASLSVMSQYFKTPSQAGERIGSFGISVSARAPEMRGLGMVEMVKRLQAMSPEERSGIIGESKELIEAYSSFESGMSRIEDLKTSIRREMDMAGTQGDRVSQITENFLSSDANAAYLERERQKARLEIAQEREMSTTGFGLETQRLRRRAEAFEEGRSWFDIGLSRHFGSLGDDYLGPWGGMVAEEAGFYTTPLTGVNQAYRNMMDARQNYSNRNNSADKAIRESLLQISAQQAGPSTLARPDVDR